MLLLNKSNLPLLVDRILQTRDLSLVHFSYSALTVRSACGFLLRLQRLAVGSVASAKSQLRILVMLSSAVTLQHGSLTARE